MGGQPSSGCNMHRTAGSDFQPQNARDVSSTLRPDTYLCGLQVAGSNGRPVMRQVMDACPAQDGRPAMGPALRVQAGPCPVQADLSGFATSFQLFAASASKHPGRPCLGWRHAGGSTPWAWLTYAQALQQVEQLAAGLAACGLKKGSCCGIISAPCKEWMLAAQACCRRADALPPVALLVLHHHPRALQGVNAHCTGLLQARSYLHAHPSCRGSFALLCVALQPCSAETLRLHCRSVLC